MKATTVAQRLGVSGHELQEMKECQQRFVIDGDVYLVERVDAPRNSQEQYFYRYLNLSDERFAPIELPYERSFYINKMTRKIVPSRKGVNKATVRHYWVRFSQEVLRRMDMQCVEEYGEFGALREAVQLHRWETASLIVESCEDEALKAQMTEYFESSAIHEIQRLNTALTVVIKDRDVTVMKSTLMVDGVEVECG
jgi:hypothetical protein